MSVMSLGVTNTDKLFLEFIMPGMNIQIRENSKMYDRFKTNVDRVVGKYAVFKSLTASPKSFRPSSSSTLPTAKQGTYDEFVLYMKRGGYGQLQFDGLAIACGKGEGAVKDILKSEVEAITIYIANRLNKQFWGDGSGRLAEVNGAVSNSTSVEVDGPLFGQDTNGRTNPAEYLAEGQGIDIYDSSGNLEAEDVELTTILDNSDGTATLTMAENVTCSDGAYLFDHNTYAASQAAGTGVPMGLAGIINTSDPYTGITSTDFQGVDRTTKSWARAQSVDMEDLAIKNAKILEAIQAAEKFGKVSAIFTNEKIWRAYYEILEADKTMPNDPAFWGGLSGISFYGGKKGRLPIIHDTDCPDNKMFFFDDKYLQVYSPIKNGMTWIRGDSGILTRVQGKDEWTAQLVWYYNFGSPKPQAMSYLYDIKHASS